MKLKWDQTGEHWHELGTDHGILFVQNSDGSYKTGVAWNGLTGVTESPSGAEANDMYADDIKYASIRSAETFSGTIEAYQAPEEFGQCDGTESPVPGLYLGQQLRKPFGFAYRTKVGNDTATDSDDAYKIHLIYNATASPSEKQYQTINESPEAITFSWELSTTPIPVEGYKPVSTITIDSRKLDPVYQDGCMDEFLDILNGTDSSESTLLSPKEIIDIFKIVQLIPSSYTMETNNTVLDTIWLNDTNPENAILVITNPIVYTRYGTTYTYYPTEIGTTSSSSKNILNGEHNDLPIKKIIVESGYTKIRKNAFSSLSVKTVKLPETITSIGYAAFMGSKIERIELPDSIISFNSQVFYNCRELAKVKFPKRLTHLGNATLADCVSLDPKNIIWPTTDFSFGYSFFSNCRFESFVFPNNFNGTIIEASAFSGNPNLKHIVIPSGVEQLGQNVFRNCTSLEYVVLPRTITHLSTQYNTSPFVNVPKLKDIYYAGTEDEWASIEKGPSESDCIPSGVTIHCNSTGPTN